jgi:hypothetical protein
MRFEAYDFSISDEQQRRAALAREPADDLEGNRQGELP